jgi:hypothetical protein
MGLNRDEARAVDLGAWEEKRVSEIVDNKEDCGGEGEDGGIEPINNDQPNLLT